MKQKVNLPRTPPITPHKLRVPRRPFGFRVPRQHALQRHAHALHVVHWGPALWRQEVEADYAVAVDVWVEGDWVRGEGEEDYFGGF